MRSVHVSISGRVQGVGFRAWLARTASAKGLSGWVRNRRTGEVEAVLSGSDGAVEAVLTAAHVGPAGARVDEVLILSEAAPLDGAFEVLATV